MGEPSAASSAVPPLLLVVPNGFDICLCTGALCPHRFLCLRFLAEPVGRQDFFGALPLLPDGSCSEYRDGREAFRRALNPKAIEQRAYFLSMHTLPREDCIWFLAEMQLRIRHLFTAQWDPENPRQVTIAPDSISDAVLREHAYFIWKDHGFSLPELHWFLAEQQILWEALLQRAARVAKRYGGDP